MSTACRRPKVKSTALAPRRLRNIRSTVPSIRTSFALALLASLNTAKMLRAASSGVGIVRISTLIPSEQGTRSTTPCSQSLLFASPQNSPRLQARPKPYSAHDGHLTSLEQLLDFPQWPRCRTRSKWITLAVTPTIRAPGSARSFEPRLKRGQAERGLRQGELPACSRQRGAEQMIRRNMVSSRNR
jgi:hypothetical protein